MKIIDWFNDVTGRTAKKQEALRLKSLADPKVTSAYMSDGDRARAFRERGKRQRRRVR